MASARWIVESLWAITNDVRFIIRFASASCTSSSASLSSAEVASSSTRIGAFFRSAPALADDGLVAVLERADELVRVSGARRRLDLVPARARHAVGDVLRHGLVEQHDFLRDDADLLPEGRQRDVAHVDAVNEDASGADVVESGQQVDEGRLPRTA